ncbi:hypothetical protein IFR05_000109 [Cadophora sp. M221]|nr:hypothetical protein IFR05_000109 [Cadophora sp. M221]
MTFAWESENWSRDREENQLTVLKGSTATESLEISSLKEWLDARARQVSALPRVITGSQRPELENNNGENVSESRDLKEWLNSRERKAGLMRGAAFSLKSAFTRPTFVPDPATPPFTPRSVSHPIESTSHAQTAAGTISLEVCE